MTANTTSPLAAITVDMDGLRRMLSQRAFASRPETDLDIIYTVGLPRLLALFDEANVSATFFVNGVDFEGNDRLTALVRQAFDRGHEIANHGYAHRAWLTHATFEQTAEEIRRGGEAIEQATGASPVGFRAPDYNVTPAVLDILEADGYRYDTSTLPTWWRPAWQGLHWVNNNFRRHPTLGKPWTIMFAPDTPYRLGATPAKRGERAIIELPNCVDPVSRFPFWGTSYIKWGRKGFDTLLARQERAGVGYFMFLMHGVDALDLVDIGDERLGKKPGLPLVWKKKQQEWRYLLERTKERYRIVRCDTMAEVYQKSLR